MEINLLEQATIDKIAAGEVVERPASVVKELVENAIDAGATAVTVEIKEGGIALIRVTDDGCGIAKEQISKAFLRHATSKIRSAEDLTRVRSLGFRGEALSSIAAVAEVEVISKTTENLTGLRYSLWGGQPPQLEEIGAPNGTTFLIRNLFYNVPARRKFLKQPPTEGSYIADLMEHMALSRPDIAFKFVNNGQTRFHTSGRNDLKEVVYRIYGRDVVNSLLPIHAERTAAASLHDNVQPGNIRITGYLGKPELSRANRSYEFFFVNGRYVKSEMLSKGLEEGYKQFLMQHKFPFAILQIEISTDMVDINVHPTKMEIRFAKEVEMITFLAEKVKEAFAQKELIPSTDLVNKKRTATVNPKAPEPFEIRRIKAERESTANMVVKEEPEYKLQEKALRMQENYENLQDKIQKSGIRKVLGDISENNKKNEQIHDNIIKAGNHILVESAQMNFFDDKFLTAEARSHYEILGQVFGTYWLVAFKERLVIIDQHAAHEKVKFERFMKELAMKTVQSQTISPPVVLQLSGREESLLKEHEASFTAAGFEIEPFGENTYAIRGVPMDLYGCHEAAFFHEILDELAENGKGDGATVYERRLASAACKAAVKGNTKLSRAELESLITELLLLDNPYHCPHGRPTMIAMSRYEVEKKFKRIL